MPMELAPLTRKLGLKRTRQGGVQIRTGRLGGREVVAIVTGMGPALATAGLERLLDAVPVDEVAVVGITGALEAETPIGTLIRVEAVVDGASGTEYRPGSSAKEPVGGKPGKMWTTGGLTTDAAELARLRSQGVVALDMETAALAAVCERRGIPWSVFRAISDRASDGSVDDEIFGLSNMDGTPNWVKVMSFFARHPGRLPRMAHLARGAYLGARRAAEAAVQAFG
jgi:adenosylhomocysteine nucleosidase